MKESIRGLSLLHHLLDNLIELASVNNVSLALSSKMRGIMKLFSQRTPKNRKRLSIILTDDRLVY